MQWWAWLSQFSSSGTELDHFNEMNRYRISCTVTLIGEGVKEGLKDKELFNVLTIFARVFKTTGFHFKLNKY